MIDPLNELGAPLMPANKINFTKATLDALPMPEKGKRVRHFDAKTRGLMLAVTGNGAKSFYVYRKVGGRPKEILIGTYPDLSVEQARRKADEINGQIALGEDPQKGRRQLAASPSLKELFTWYLDHHAKPHKASWHEEQAQFNRYVADWAGRKASQITRADVRERHAKIGRDHGLYAANRLLALVRLVYNKALKDKEIKGDNPATGITAFREQSRDRRVTAAEVPAFFQSVADEPNEDVRDYVLLSLFTGARRANLLAMRWDEIDPVTAMWRIPLTKNGTAQEVPLGNLEVGILDRRKVSATSPWVFPGSGETGHLVEPKKSWRRLVERAGIKDLRLHDLRRTLGSWMVDTGATLAVIGKTLNHQSQATTAIYARLSMDPVREAKDRALSAMMAAANAQERPKADADALDGESRVWPGADLAPTPLP